MPCLCQQLLIERMFSSAKNGGTERTFELLALWVHVPGGGGGGGCLQVEMHSAGMAGQQKMYLAYVYINSTWLDWQDEDT